MLKEIQIILDMKYKLDGKESHENLEIVAKYLMRNR